MHRPRAVYVFDAFRYDAQSRRLTSRDVTVALLPRTLALLEFYLRSSGQLVSKAEIFAALWPDDPSPEQNLAQHVYLLRKALRAHAPDRVYLVTEHGRGHRFVGETSIETAYDEPGSEAQRLSLRGRYFCERRTAEGFGRAEEYFARAAALDPAYAPAQAGLADAYVLMGEYLTRTPEGAFPPARAAALRAVELDPGLAGPYSALGEIALYYDRNFEEAARCYARALVADPASTAALVYRSWFNNVRGAFAEAAADAAAANAIAPYDLNVLTVVGVCQLFQRNYDRAAEQFELVLDLEPGYRHAAYYAAITDALRGDYDRTLERLSVAPAPHREQADFALAAYAARLSGRDDLAAEMQARLDALIAAGRYVSAFNRSKPLIAAGALDRAVDVLTRGLEDHDPWVVFALHHPLCAPLRESPRFDAFAAALLGGER